MKHAITISMTPLQRDQLCKWMAGDNGELLIDLVTDGIVLADEAAGLTPEERKGAGRVLKFLRVLRDNSEAFVVTRTEKQANE